MNTPKKRTSRFDTKASKSDPQRGRTDQHRIATRALLDSRAAEWGIIRVMNTTQKTMRKTKTIIAITGLMVVGAGCTLPEYTPPVRYPAAVHTIYHQDGKPAYYIRCYLSDGYSYAGCPTAAGMICKEKGYRQLDGSITSPSMIIRCNE